MVQRIGEPRKNANQIQNYLFYGSAQERVGNQVGIKKLTIRTRTDSNEKDPGMINETTSQIYGAGIAPKETTTTAKARSKLRVNVKTMHYVQKITKICYRLEKN